jgi:protocatechuate 3,4-dioxygenase alpha subunit
MNGHLQTPSQTIGPFFHDALMRDGVDDLDPGRAAGSPLIVSGTVYDGSGTPIDDAMLEVWQSDGEGRFRHPLDHWEGQVPGSFIGFGRVATDLQGDFRLRSVMPGTVPDPRGGTQAPHFNLHIFTRGLLDRLTTRIYFEGEPANADDPVLRAADPSRRATLLAVPDGEEDGVACYRFDIRLQGEGETIFFDA